MSLIESRENISDQVVEGRFIRSVLSQAGQDIDKAQRAAMSSRGFENNNWYNDRSFTATETELGYTHLKKHRFVDMKYRTSKAGRNRKKHHPIHNRIVWGHYNEIIKQLHFGFTEAVKQELRKLEK